ncbi:MAG: IgGFc-binding protein, partial [Imperialibacter sp.]
MDNWLQDPNNPIRLELYISADDTTSGIVDMPLVSGWQPLQFTVIPGVTTSLSVPANVAMAFGSGLVQNKGIHITTEKNVSVYAMNKRQYSADMALILPVYSLGSDYFAMSHWESGNRDNNSHSDAELLIVAVSDGTEIEITPSVNAIGAHPAGTPFLVTLNQGQVYQLQAGSDLTGTHIRSVNTVEGTCSNFAVFGGNRYTKVGQCEHPDGHDHLFAQMYPVDTWGKEYITVPFASRLGGDLVKVLATEEGTNVTVNKVAYE